MKKAMSPLISTIALIGFAIALGGIVMGWGERNYGPDEKKGCDAASVKLIAYGDYEGACTSAEGIKFTIQNDGQVALEGIKVIAVSDEVNDFTVTESIPVAGV